MTILFSISMELPLFLIGALKKNPAHWLTPETLTQLIWGLVLADSGVVKAPWWFKKWGSAG